VLIYFFPWGSCSIRLVPTCILPAKEIWLLGKFQPDSFKTERLVCVETDRQTDMARSTRLVMLTKNLYTLWGHCVANFWLKSIYPLKRYKKKWSFGAVRCRLLYHLLLARVFELFPNFWYFLELYVMPFWLLLSRLLVYNLVLD